MASAKIAATHSQIQKKKAKALPLRLPYTTQQFEYLQKEKRIKTAK